MKLVPAILLAILAAVPPAPAGEATSRPSTPRACRLVGPDPNPGPARSEVDPRTLPGRPPARQPSDGRRVSQGRV